MKGYEKAPSEPRKKRFGAAKAAALVGLLFSSSPTIGHEVTREEAINFWGGQKVVDQLGASRGDSKPQKIKAGSVFTALSKEDQAKEVEKFWGGKGAMDALSAPRK